MVRVRITPSGGVVGEDGTEWHPGTEHDASEAFAAELAARGCAVVVVASVERAPAAGPVAAVESRDPALTTASAPALSTRRGRR